LYCIEQIEVSDSISAESPGHLMWFYAVVTAHLGLFCISVQTGLSCLHIHVFFFAVNVFCTICIILIIIISCNYIWD